MKCGAQVQVLSINGGGGGAAAGREQLNNCFVIKDFREMCGFIRFERSYDVEFTFFQFRECFACC